MPKIELRVPDLGEFEDVPIVEILIKPGDAVAVDDDLITVESDKATMEVPSSEAAIITEIHVAIGDTVSSGDLIATAEAIDATGPITDATSWSEVGAEVRNVVQQDRTDLVVIGAGPGGYAAAFRAADLGVQVTLVDPGPTLGGVCLNVGCIPSKALLHVSHIKEHAESLGSSGIGFGTAIIDIDGLRAHKDRLVSGLTNGLSKMAASRHVRVISATATFTSTHELCLTDDTGETRLLEFSNCIIAAGSRPIALPNIPDDERVLDSTSALDLPSIPKRMLIIGGGIIGLEMATIYSALGARIDLVELGEQLLSGVDADLTRVWLQKNQHRFDRIMMTTRLESVVPTPDGLIAEFSGDHEEATYGLILQAVGRSGNADRLELAEAGVQSTNGLIKVDASMRTNQPHIFAVGDIVGQPMLAHKATHQGHVAAEVISGHKQAFDPQIIPSVAYTDPEIAWAGVTETSAKEAGRSVEVARFPWAASGRALCQDAGFGMTKLIFDPDDGRIIGGAIVGPNAGDLIGEVCLAIEMGADKIDIAKTIHPHPTLGETIGLASEVALASCTDLPAQRPIRSS